MNVNPSPLDGPRAVRPDEVEAVVRLIDDVFAPEQRDMYRRFPVLFAEDNLENWRVFLDGGRPVSCMAYQVREAVVGGPVLTTACLGAVCTAQAHRGRGLASRLLDDCEERMRTQGVDVVIISGNRGLYLRSGARTVGMRRQYTLTPETAAALADETVTARPASPAEADILAALHETSPVRFVRSRRDWERWLSCGRCENMVSEPFVGMVAGTPRAYVVHKHTRPSGEAISAAGEWAGDPDVTAALFAVILRRRDREYLHVVVDLPRDADLVRRLDAAGVPWIPVKAGPTYKVLRPAALFEKVRPYLPQAARGIRVHDTDGGATLQLGDASLPLPVDEVARAFFGDPEDSVNGKLAAAGELGRAWRSRFPLSLPRYGYNYA